MDVQAIHEQWRMLGPISVPAVFDDVIREHADGIEVFVGVVWISGVGSEAHGDLTKEKCTDSSSKFESEH